MIFSKKIFREYDIRGIYNNDYDDDFAGLLGEAISVFLKKSIPAKTNRNYRIAIGRDARPSGNSLLKRLIDSFNNHGIEVYDLGVVPTPLTYFSLHHCDVDGSICITGSHNPSEYNGFKICIGKSTLFGSQIQELYALCEQLKLETKKELDFKASTSGFNIISPYIEYILSNIKLERRIKVVIDSGNGAACVVAPKLLDKMNCEVIPLFCELDGTFPNHHPDPTVVDNLQDLIREVKKQNADVGIAFDGDADRIGVVDEKGNPIFGDELLVLYAREILSRKPGATIISEVKSSHKLYNDIAKHGGKPVMWKTGHSLIKSKMKELKAELAGEMSGHVFFADRYFGYDDAVYAAVRLLEILSHSNQTLSSLLADLPKTVSTPEIRVDCEDELKFKVVEQVCQNLKKKFKVVDIDGVRIETEQGWGLLRASNTQPVVVMRFEAQNETELNQLKKIIENEFERAKQQIRS